MTNILPFKKKTPAQKHKGKTLCKSGFHQWKACSKKQFDVKQGKLVSVFRCLRCDKEKVTLT